MLFVSVGLLEFPTACWAQRFLADSKAATSSGYWAAGARKQPASKQILLWDSPEEAPRALQTDWFDMTLTLHVRKFVSDSVYTCLGDKYVVKLGLSDPGGVALLLTTAHTLSDFWL